MIEPKMSLILILPGSIMVSQQVAENKPDYVRQVIKINKETYLAMLQESTDTKYNKIVGKLHGKPVRAWDRLSENDRITKHCELIANDLHALSFSFNVLDD